MNRFIYRKDHRTSDIQRFDLPNRAEMLGLKLAAAEAQLIELKTLLDEAKNDEAARNARDPTGRNPVQRLKQVG